MILIHFWPSFCVEFQMYPLKFHTKYLTHTLKDMIFLGSLYFIQRICCKELEIQMKYTKYTLMILLVCVTVIHSCRRVGIMPLNSSLPGQNGRHFTDDSFKYIFMNEKFCILIWISLKLVPYGLIDNKSVLVHVMAWYQTSDKPLPKPMMTQFTDVYMWH